jgi:acetyl-CoA acetyltransferase
MQHNTTRAPQDSFTAHSLRNAAARLKAIKFKDDIVSIDARLANPATEEDGALVDLYGGFRDGDTSAGQSSLP